MLFYSPTSLHQLVSTHKCFKCIPLPLCRFICSTPSESDYRPFKKKIRAYGVAKSHVGRGFIVSCRATLGSWRIGELPSVNGQSISSRPCKYKIISLTYVYIGCILYLIADLDLAHTPPMNQLMTSARMKEAKKTPFLYMYLGLPLSYIVGTYLESSAVNRPPAFRLDSRARKVLGEEQKS
ncbi:hypothetical protein K439DRAFT_381889 [Ramaria rubella]|nr:hypothetical protein K439DRAFT_381889 [Ramaria rubella]